MRKMAPPMKPSCHQLRNCIMSSNKPGERQEFEDVPRWHTKKEFA
ncbi:hypothetical protein F443_22950 [Phytophthora nicotianae P1569]|uniref:Uncharacterized protein n=1 Tax=Phytophthora nicotianae P1569 TaxID=1317065 RepID=V9DVB2_PHYNI|nr:hypothetical protein F443_22950 [Phytophthora nicotianae P1569]